MHKVANMAERLVSGVTDISRVEEEKRKGTCGVKLA